MIFASGLRGLFNGLVGVACAVGESVRDGVTAVALRVLKHPENTQPSTGPMSHAIIRFARSEEWPGALRLFDILARLGLLSPSADLQFNRQLHPPGHHLLDLFGFPREPPSLTCAKIDTILANPSRCYLQPRHFTEDTIDRLIIPGTWDCDGFLKLFDTLSWDKEDLLVHAFFNDTAFAAAINTRLGRKISNQSEFKLAIRGLAEADQVSICNYLKGEARKRLEVFSRHLNSKHPHKSHAFFHAKSKMLARLLLAILEELPRQERLTPILTLALNMTEPSSFDLLLAIQTALAPLIQLRPDRKNPKFKEQYQLAYLFSAETLRIKIAKQYSVIIGKILALELAKRGLDRTEIDRDPDLRPLVELLLSLGFFSMGIHPGEFGVGLTTLWSNHQLARMRQNMQSTYMRELMKLVHAEEDFCKWVELFISSSSDLTDLEKADLLKSFSRGVLSPTTKDATLEAYRRVFFTALGIYGVFDDSSWELA